MNQNSLFSLLALGTAALGLALYRLPMMPL